MIFGLFAIYIKPVFVSVITLKEEKCAIQGDRNYNNPPELVVVIASSCNKQRNKLAQTDFTNNNIITV